MGINHHELSFLRYNFKKKNFKQLGILGRQENYIDSQSNIIPNQFKKFAKEKYSDNLLKELFSLNKLITYDVSEKDLPSKILNFNNLVDQPEKFDAFFDGGSLQHTFNVQFVMKNISNHVKIGGSIIHVVSSNNLCGFGFYQFSPEFFIKYYCKKNGFKNTEIFVADYDNHYNWYRVNLKFFGNLNINTSARLICLVRTEKFSDLEISDIFQDSFSTDENYNQNKNKFLFVSKKKLFDIYAKILIIIDLFSKKINLLRNKNLKAVKILDLLD